MARPKSTDEAANNESPTPPPTVIQVVQEKPVSPTIIEGFAETVPGGRYMVDGKQVDAWNKPFAGDAQDASVVADSVEADKDLSKLSPT